MLWKRFFKTFVWGISSILAKQWNLTRRFELSSILAKQWKLTRRFELVTRGFELETRNLCFTFLTYNIQHKTLDSPFKLLRKYLKDQILLFYMMSSPTFFFEIAVDILYNSVIAYLINFVQKN